MTLSTVSDVHHCNMVPWMRAIAHSEALVTVGFQRHCLTNILKCSTFSSVFSVSLARFWFKPFPRLRWSDTFQGCERCLSKRTPQCSIAIVTESHKEESLELLKDTQDSLIQEYYQKHTHGNPFTAVILEHVLERNGKTPKIYEKLPETLKEYLRRRGFRDDFSAQILSISGLTLVEAIMKMMQYNGRKAQALSNFPSLVKDPQTRRLLLELARQARNMYPETRSKHFKKSSRKI